MNFQANLCHATMYRIPGEISSKQNPLLLNVTDEWQCKIIIEAISFQRIALENDDRLISLVRRDIAKILSLLKL